MATLVRFVMSDGKVVSGISYRMNTSLDADVVRPRYNIQAPLGWVPVVRADVARSEAKMGRPT